MEKIAALISDCLIDTLKGGDIPHRRAILLIDALIAEREKVAALEAENAKLKADFDAAGNYIPHSQIDGDLRATKAKVAALEAEVESLKDRMQFNKVDQHYAHIAAMKIAEAEATRWREVATDLAQIVQGLEATICHVNPSSVALASRAALTRYKQERDQ